MAERPIGERPSQFASWARWLSAGLVLAGVAMVSQRMPHVEMVVGFVVLALVGSALAVWVIRELFEWVKETIEDFMHDLSKRRSANHDHR